MMTTILTKKSWPIEVENSGELLKPLKGTFLSVRPSVHRSRTEVSPGQKSSRCCGGNGGNGGGTIGITVTQL